MTDGAARPDGPDADPVGIAREIALRLLTIRPRSYAELGAAMARRGVPADAAAEVLERFAEVGLVDDLSFARAWVDSGARRTHGRQVLARELAAKGVGRDVICEVLGERDESNELERAIEFAGKKARATKGLDSTTRFRRLSGALARRGFSAETVLRATKAVLAESPTEWVE